MNRFLRVLGSLCTLALPLIAAPGSARSAAKIFTQSPCTVSGGPCKSFYFGDPIPVIRGFSFTLPSAGTAEVTFHGSAVCSSSESTDRVVDLASQIVTTPTAAVNANGPGGLRHALVLKDEVEHDFSSSDTFNLASTRVITYTSGGNKAVYFKMARSRMDARTACTIYNATFSVTFIP